ncbi:MAG: hypothetical protein JSV88_19140 [Candidatus Aminicenantes bacterium]|nr:MAG: hypothetical protein JSV88_19140 [Candidatus Aminicenantes bacterium]
MDSKIRVVAVFMGLGHMRAAFPLRDLSHEDIIIYGSKHNTTRKEYRRWKKIRNIYYFLSRAGRIPIIGKYILAMMLTIQKIEPYYPVKDRSKPTSAVRYLDHLIKKKGLCAALIEKIPDADTRTVHTFYATAIALEMKIDDSHTHDNYLLICDSDFNRVWVPPDPGNSRLKYLAPCTPVKKRLLTYGVPKENIFLTGFPLPKENLGSEENLEILKEDLWERLLRLDPANKFLSIQKKSVFYWLNKRTLPKKRETHFNLMFAVGGAGAQTHIVEKILKSLKEKIHHQEIKVHISIGINREIFETVLGYINSLGLQEYLNKGISLIFDKDIFKYFHKFNRALHHTDVLWTKPSELSFYCGLGIPILMAPPIGTHEEMNRRWLQQMHTGITPPGKTEYVHEWLFDLRENGILASAAWDGFLRVRKLGTYKIEELVRTGNFTQSLHPLEQ